MNDNIITIKRAADDSIDESIERLEKLYITSFGSLPFTPHDEMMAYEEKLNQGLHAKNFKLKDLRESKRITIPDMAQLLALSKDGYFKIESGVSVPKLPVAFKIAKLLGTTVEELFDVSL